MHKCNERTRNTYSVRVRMLPLLLGAWVLCLVSFFSLQNSSARRKLCVAVIVRKERILRNRRGELVQNRSIALRHTTRVLYVLSRPGFLSCPHLLLRSSPPLFRTLCVYVSRSIGLRLAHQFPCSSCRRCRSCRRLILFPFCSSPAFVLCLMHLSPS